MSSLIVCHDLHIMMLDFVVEKIFVPHTSVFDKAVLKKTCVKFQLLDTDWIELRPQRNNYMIYNGSNTEEELFNGGKSIVFSVSESMFDDENINVNITVIAHKEMSKYFEVEPFYNIGTASININQLFNGIIIEMKKRKNMIGYFDYYHEREPLSKSMKSTYLFTTTDSIDESSKIPYVTVYVRLSYFGKSIITEIERFPNSLFNIREETCSTPYQFLELKRDELEGGCWGDRVIKHEINQSNLNCICDKDTIKKYNNGRIEMDIDGENQKDDRALFNKINNGITIKSINAEKNDVDKFGENEKNNVGKKKKLNNINDLTKIDVTNKNNDKNRKLKNDADNDKEGRQKNHKKLQEKLNEGKIKNDKINYIGKKKTKVIENYENNQNEREKKTLHESRTTKKNLSSTNKHSSSTNKHSSSTNKRSSSTNNIINKKTTKKEHGRSISAPEKSNITKNDKKLKKETIDFNIVGKVTKKSSSSAERNFSKSIKRVPTGNVTVGLPEKKQKSSGNIFKSIQPCPTYCCNIYSNNNNSNDNCSLVKCFCNFVPPNLC
ncbi:putative uncharacterized protein DDB_G0274405 [Aphidius gifuensis]|uniref:putative uncharacterized protein DDB_G0274405 n=1 Tax=Aphidius gifuensis TaxID=684658 RepID=UPI001CDC9D19|nr:putative uncharacterized protein DDB_G0274405 [Aphidius gifuensis]